MKRLWVVGLIILTITLSSCREMPKYILVSNTSNILEQDIMKVDAIVNKSSVSDERIKHISMASVGDIMVHKTQLVKAYNGEEFDFTSVFEQVKPILSKADITVGNLETTFAGYLGQRRINIDAFYKGYSGYPCFNTPDIFATNIKAAGFDLLSTANNHTLDSKEVGALRTLDILDSIGLDHIGTYRSEIESNETYIIDVDGISFAFVNYTYGLNGFSLKEEDAYLVNSLEMYKENKIVEMTSKVKKAEATGVDFVVVMLHYGNEYKNYPDKYYQMPLVDELFDSGADIILGGHPHVLQPFEVREMTRENGEIEKCVVIYSLGNFLSSQRRIYNKGSETDTGIIFNILFEKIDEHKPEIVGITYIPTITHWAKDGIVVVPTTNVDKTLDLSGYEKERIRQANIWVPEHMKYYIGVEPTFDGLYYRYDW